MAQLVIAIGKLHQSMHEFDLLCCNQVMLHKQEMILSLLYLISILYSKHSQHQRKVRFLRYFGFYLQQMGLEQLSSTLAVAIALPPTTSVL